MLAEADDRLAGAVLDRFLASGVIGMTRGFVHLSGWGPQYAPDEARWREILLAAMTDGRFAPPGLAEVETHPAGQTGGGPHGPRGEPSAFHIAAQSLQEEGTLIEVAPGILFAGSVLEEIRGRVVAQIQRDGEVTVAALRDGLGTSRKYALALLEYFDGVRLTRRVGDRRVLAVRAGETPPPATPRAQ